MNYQIEVKSTKQKGRGVFALKDFKKGETIERCPILKLTPKERKLLERTFMAYYVYPWKTLNDAAVVLGYGSIYNHSLVPNAKWIRKYKSLNMIYKATRDIKQGEEITINYNGDYADPDEIDWFEVKK